MYLFPKLKDKHEKYKRKVRNTKSVEKKRNKLLPIFSTATIYLILFPSFNSSHIQSFLINTDKYRNHFLNKIIFINFQQKKVHSSFLKKVVVAPTPINLTISANSTIFTVYSVVAIFVFFHFCAYNNLSVIIYIKSTGHEFFF